MLLDSSFDTVARRRGARGGARLGGLADDPPYASMDLERGRLGRRVEGRSAARTGSREGVVVTASSGGERRWRFSTRSARRLWVTFWISLVVAGLLGFGFSELISRRVRAMSKAARRSPTATSSSGCPRGRPRRDLRPRGLLQPDGREARRGLLGDPGARARDRRRRRVDGRGRRRVRLGGHGARHQPRCDPTARARRRRELVGLRGEPSSPPTPAVLARRATRASRARTPRRRCRWASSRCCCTARRCATKTAPSTAPCCCSPT